MILEQKKFLQNSKGLLTVDFLFGITITFFIMLVVFRVCYSLLMVEVAQYIAFSASRAHAAADVSVAEQRKASMDKYSNLKNNKIWKSLFEDAFELTKELDVNSLKSGESAGRDFSDDYLYTNTYNGSALSGIPFIGIVINMKLKWLNMKVPFLGPTSESDYEFDTKLTAFLLREPSSDECRKFMKDRYQEILKIDSSRFAPAAAKINDYVAMEDNGC